MKRDPRVFKVNAHIVGGGLRLRLGDIVEEATLNGYADKLRKAGGIEEIASRTHNASVFPQKTASQGR